MLRRASVMDVKEGRVTRATAYVAVVMRFYPRFLRKTLIDEYIRALSPPGELFSDFKKNDRASKDHNGAFYKVSYESRFDLSPEGRERLRQLSELSRKKDVVLVCQCRDFERCHCDLLLMWAAQDDAHRAKIARVIFDYPVFRKRLESGELRLS